MKALWSLVIAVAVALGVLVAPPTASAATAIVYVDSQANSVWPVSASVTWVDYYTGSDMRFGACRTGYKCIKVREKTVSSSYSAITYGDVTCKTCVVTIYLNPQRRYTYGYYTKRSIVDHELGHANGITWHNSYCTSRMYVRVFCPNGSLPPRKFTTSEKARLSAN